MSASFSERRCRMVQLLSDAWWHLHDEGHEAPRDVQVLLEHRLRDVLTDGECPSCAAIQLAKELDEAIDGKA